MLSLTPFIATENVRSWALVGVIMR